MPGSITEIISDGSIITADKYNEIQTQVYQVVGPDFYSYDNLLSYQVTTSTTMTGEIFRNLYVDINKAVIHQTNNGMDSNMEFTVGDSIQKSWFNQLINYANQIYLNRLTYATDQMNILTTSSVRTIRWNSDIKHVVQTLWDNDSDANGFFNLGGKIYVTLFSNQVPDQLDNQRWKRLVETANVQLENFSYSRSNWISSQINEKFESTVAIEGNDTITISYLKDSTKSLTISVKLSTDPSYYEDGVDYITLDITSNINFYLSKGDSRANTGYPSPIFSTNVLYDLEQGGYVDFVPNRKISTDTQLFTFTGYTTSTTESQVLTIKNIGNTATTVTGISVDTQGGTLISNFPAVPQRLEIDESQSYNISFSDADFPGTYNGFLIVNGNFRKGPYKIPLTIKLENIPFGFTLTPDNKTIQLDVIQAETSQTFNIVLNSKYLTYDSYTVKFVDNSNNKVDIVPGFSVNTDNLLGPKIIYSPKKLPKATYTCKIAVTVKNVTQYASLTVVNNIPQNDNIANFVSAYGSLNSVVGLSYDLIQGNRYLTIGIGTGVNGAPLLSNMKDSNGVITPTNEKKYIKIENLNYSADPTFSVTQSPIFQSVVYQTTISKTSSELSTMNNNFSAFLLENGVWFDDRNITPLGLYVHKTYKFSLEYDSSCSWEFSVDDTGYFYIDNTKIINPTSNLRSSAKGQVDLTAGEHTVTIYALNNNWSGDKVSNPGSVALQIKNANSGVLIWSTKTWARDPAYGYRYWNEVYRIPLPANNNPNTFYNKDYFIKGTPNFGNSSTYSDCFSGGSLFNVSIDNLGNLNISTQPIDVTALNNINDTTSKPTITNLLYSLYYYTSLKSAVRYKNLETPSAGVSTTTVFTGFTWNGDILKKYDIYPGYASYNESTFTITPGTTKTYWRKDYPFKDNLEVVGFSAGYDTTSFTDLRSATGKISPEGSKSYSSIAVGGKMIDGTVLLDFIDLWGSSDRVGTDTFGFRITIGNFNKDPTVDHLVKIKVQCLYKNLGTEYELYSKTIDNDGTWNYKYDSTSLGNRAMWWVSDNWYNSTSYLYNFNNRYLKTSLFVPPEYNYKTNSYFYSYLGETRAGYPYYTGYHYLLMQYYFKITLITKTITK